MDRNAFTIYKHPKTTKNGPEYRWYYYYYDQNGKKVQKACKSCKTREEAEAYIQKLTPPTDLQKQSNFIKDIAENMYLPNSEHLERRNQLGKSTNPITMTESRRYVEIIIKQWGGMDITKLHSTTVMKYLFSIKRSGKWKNRLIEILNEVYAEARWYRCNVKKLDLNRFNIKTKKADYFTKNEIAKLFKPENFPAYQFYLLFLLSLAGGLRLGEVRAVKAKQIIFERDLIIIDGFLQQNGTRTTYNKKGSPENPRLRIVYLNKNILNQLHQWIHNQHIAPDDYCFTFNQKPIRSELAENIFNKALQTAGIIPATEPRPRNKRGEGRQKQIKTKAQSLDDRKLVPHSLRYTYVSQMLQHVTTTDLKPMTGHTSTVMVDYYNRKVLDMTVASLPKSLREATDSITSWSDFKITPYPETLQQELFPA